MATIIYTKRVGVQLVFSHVVHDKLADSLKGEKQDEPMDYKAESGRRLKQAREAKKWTLQDVASRLVGIGASRISNYEQGTRLMRQKEAVKLAEVLDVSAAYLMCVDEVSTMPSSKRRLLEMYDAADSRGKRTIEQTAETQAKYSQKQQLPFLPANNSQ